MHKVVYNSCHGGFALSLQAIDWLEENCKDENLRKIIKKAKEDSLYSVLQRNMYICGEISRWFHDERHHTDLVAVVEALGKEASGFCADLAIEEISGRQYRIDDYDGAEDVITPKDSDWVFIND